LGSAAFLFCFRGSYDVRSAKKTFYNNSTATRLRIGAVTLSPEEKLKISIFKYVKVLFLFVFLLIDMFFVYYEKIILFRSGIYMYCMFVRKCK